MSLPGIEEAVIGSLLFASMDNFGKHSRMEISLTHKKASTEDTTRSFGTIEERFPGLLSTPETFVSL